MDQTTCKSDAVIAACEKSFETHKANCSGFVRAVAKELGYVFPDTMRADQITQVIRGQKPNSGPAWKIKANAEDARKAALEGEFVVAGIMGSEYSSDMGHVSVVIGDALVFSSSVGQKVPIGYWGAFGSVGSKRKSLAYSFNKQSFKDGKVTYASIPLEVACIDVAQPSVPAPKKIELPYMTNKFNVAHSTPMFTRR